MVALTKKVPNSQPSISKISFFTPTKMPPECPTAGIQFHTKCFPGVRLSSSLGLKSFLIVSWRPTISTFSWARSSFHCRILAPFPLYSRRESSLITDPFEFPAQPIPPLPPLFSSWVFFWWSLELSPVFFVGCQQILVLNSPPPKYACPSSILPFFLYIASAMTARAISSSFIALKVSTTSSSDPHDECHNLQQNPPEIHDPLSSKY